MRIAQNTGTAEPAPICGRARAAGGAELLVEIGACAHAVALAQWAWIALGSRDSGDLGVLDVRGVALGEV